MNHRYQKDIAGCGLTGLINKEMGMVPGEVIVESINNMVDRGNGLGAGFAAYGIYPEYMEYYALHIMYDNEVAISKTEAFINEHLYTAHQERIPHRHTKSIKEHPRLRRYFVRPKEDLDESMISKGLDLAEDDTMVRTVMTINLEFEGTFVFSSGKNMGVFKGVGFPEEIADFFRVEDYKGYLWTAHSRFPTNTPGWWGGAHPFTILDWSIVHNGRSAHTGLTSATWRCLAITAP